MHEQAYFTKKVIGTCTSITVTFSFEVGYVVKFAVAEVVGVSMEMAALQTACLLGLG